MKDLKNLDKLFETAEQISSDENFALIEKECQEVEVMPNLRKEDIIKMDNIKDDFDLARSTLQTSIISAKLVLDKITQDVIEGETLNGEQTTGFAELIKSINDSVKQISNLYKDFTKTLNDLKNSSQPKVTNNLIINTTKLIDDLKELNDIKDI